MWTKGILLTIGHIFCSMVENKKNIMRIYQEDDEIRETDPAKEQLPPFLGYVLHLLACMKQAFLAFLKKESSLKEYLLTKGRYRQKDNSEKTDDSSEFELELKDGTSLSDIFKDIWFFYKKKGADGFHKEKNLMMIIWANPQKSEQHVRATITNAPNAKICKIWIY